MNNNALSSTKNSQLEKNFNFDFFFLEMANNMASTKYVVRNSKVFHALFREALKNSVHVAGQLT